MKSYEERLSLPDIKMYNKVRVTRSKFIIMVQIENQWNRLQSLEMDLHVLEFDIQDHI